jgi:hypothetical protein
MCQVNSTDNTIIAESCLEIKADVMESANIFLATQYTVVDGQKVLNYSSFFDLVVKHLIDCIIGPILDIYPTANIKTLKDNAITAQAAIEAAKASSLSKK